MTIPFTSTPGNLRTPLFFAELDNSRANRGQAIQRTLIIGQMLSVGTYTAGIPALMESIPAVKTGAGQGSMLARMADFYRRADGFGEVWLLPIADNGSGVAATGTIAFTAAATAAGTLNLYVGGDRVQQAVTSAQTTAQIATALAATINALPDLPVTALASTSTVTLTAKSKGANGNDIDIRANYMGSAGGEVTPTGLTFTITAMASGATNPVLDTPLSNLGEVSYDFIAFPFNDSTSLDAIKTYLASQWDPTRMLYGGAFAAYRGTLGSAVTFGAARNDPHVSIMAIYDSPTQPSLWAANVCGKAAASLRNDPGLPLHTLPLNVLAPPVASRFKLTERNTLLWNGLSTFTVDDDGTVRLETQITTYQKNPFGQADDSYLFVERLFTLAAVIRDLKTFLTSTFGRMKLADDGTNFRPGSNIVTPSIIKNAIIGRYRRLERDGLVQNSDAFAAAILVQRNANNTCRVDGLLPVVPIDQLRQIAVLVQFRNAGDVE